jgi:hypothetical protein
MWRHNPEDQSPYFHLHENFRHHSYKQGVLEQIAAELGEQK